MIKDEDLARYHDAARKIEADGVEAYHTVAEIHGTEVANLLLVAHLRRGYNPKGQWPTPPDVVGKVNTLLAKNGLLQETIRGRDLAKSWWKNATEAERREWMESIGGTAFVEAMLKSRKKSDQE